MDEPFEGAYILRTSLFGYDSSLPLIDIPGVDRPTSSIKTYVLQGLVSFLFLFTRVLDICTLYVFDRVVADDHRHSVCVNYSQQTAYYLFQLN
jgi:hypothetical protein